jgi:hypothetical protein
MDGLRLPRTLASCQSGHDNRIAGGPHDPFSYRLSRKSYDRTQVRLQILR